MAKLKWKGMAPEAITKAKLKELTPILVSAVPLIISDCAGKGLQLVIEPTYGGGRSDSDQLAVSASGGSKTKNKSKHQTSRFPDKLAHAADLVKYLVKKAVVIDFNWDMSTREKLLIASSAWARGLGSGLLFGLSKSEKELVKQAIRKCRSAKWPTTPEFYGQFGKLHLGFDPYHVQTVDNWGK